MGALLLLLLLLPMIAHGLLEPKFANPDMYTCGTNASMNDNHQGFVMVNAGSTKLAYKCIFIQRWDAQRQSFDWDATAPINPQVHRVAENATFFKALNHDQESLVLSTDQWFTLVPTAQNISMLYEDTMSSKCHPGSLPDTFYCYDTVAKAVSPCSNDTDQDKLSIVYELADFELFKIENSTTTTAVTMTPPPFLNGRTYRQVDKVQEHIIDFVGGSDEHIHPCVTAIAGNGATVTAAGGLLFVTLTAAALFISL